MNDPKKLPAGAAPGARTAAGIKTAPGAKPPVPRPRPHCIPRADGSCSVHGGGGVVGADGLCVEGRPPVPRSAVAAVVQPAATPVVQPAAAPVVQPAAAPVVQPAAAPVVQPAAAPVVQPAAAPVAPAASRLPPNDIQAMQRILEELGSEGARFETEAEGERLLETMQAAVLPILLQRIDTMGAHRCALALQWLEPIQRGLLQRLARLGEEPSPAGVSPPPDAS
jgi:hypothetical protein